MDISTIIIILAIILVILFILNNITIIKVPSSSKSQATCSETTFGCCPDGVNSKINFYGTNCPTYNPKPGYPLYNEHLHPNYPKAIGGCEGTMYGCCPNNYTPKTDMKGSNCV
jgi:hypothetical protein